MRFAAASKAFVCWLFIFTVATLCEFAARVIFLHSSWTGSHTLARVYPNLIAAGVVAAGSGLFYVLLMGLLKERVSFLRPAAAVALSVFCAVPAGHQVHAELAAHAPWIRVVGAVSAGLIAYMVVFVISRKLLSFLDARKRIPVLLMTTLLPVIILGGRFFYRTSSQKVPHGPIRHIVLISIDTLRYDYISAYYPRNVQTPVLDQIGREGVRFEVAVSPVPQTGPSHVSMLTGLSPLDHGIFLNGQPLPRTAKTIAHQLMEAGYETAGFVSGFPLKDFNCNLQTGFGVYDDTMAFNDRFRDVYYGKMLGKLPFFQWGVYRQAHEVTEPALNWLQKNTDSPFFLFLHYYDPHYPYGIKPERRKFKRPMFVRIPKSDIANQKRLYGEEVRFVDQQISRVIDFLKKAGIYDRTLLMITSDHGESLGEHEAYFTHERFIYEQMIRVPLMIRCPILIRPGVVFQKQVAMLDVYKTIAAAARVSPLPGDRGYDLIQLLQDSSRYERTIPSYHFAYDVEGIRSDRWKLIHNGANETKSDKRRHKTKPKQPFELYDLLNDPGETVNRYEEEPEMARSLLNQLRRRSHFQTDTQNLTEEQIEVLKSLGYIQ